MPSSRFTGFYVIAPHFVPSGGQTSFPTSPSEPRPPLSRSLSTVHNFRMAKNGYSTCEVLADPREIEIASR